MRYICKNGFEHHAAMSASHNGGVLAEAFENTLAGKTYHHDAGVDWIGRGGQIRTDDLCSQADALPGCATPRHLHCTRV